MVGCALRRASVLSRVLGLFLPLKYRNEIPMVFMDQDSYALTFSHMCDHDEYRADMTMNVNRNSNGFVQSILLDVVVTAKTIDGDYTKAISVPVTWSEAFAQALYFEQDIPAAFKQLEKAVAQRSQVTKLVENNPDVSWDGLLDLPMLDALQAGLETTSRSEA